LLHGRVARAAGSSAQPPAPEAPRAALGACRRLTTFNHATTLGRFCAEREDAPGEIYRASQPSAYGSPGGWR
jgi:hypothetical protein